MVRLLPGRNGRFAWVLQYAYALRIRWTGLPVFGNGIDGVGAKGIDNMFWTCFRYYLP